MAGVEHFRIEIEEDFVARQTRAEPLHALAELIWNSVDADASRVTVEFEFKDLAHGMSKIVVYDVSFARLMLRPYGPARRSACGY